MPTMIIWYFLMRPPLSGFQHKQQCTTLSIANAKCIVPSLTCKEIVWACNLLQELGHPQSELIILPYNNQSAIHLVFNPQFHHCTKYIWHQRSQFHSWLFNFVKRFLCIHGWCCGLHLPKSQTLEGRLTTQPFFLMA